MVIHHRQFSHIEVVPDVFATIILTTTFPKLPSILICFSNCLPYLELNYGQGHGAYHFYQ